VPIAVGRSNRGINPRHCCLPIQRFAARRGTLRYLIRSLEEDEYRQIVDEARHVFSAPHLIHAVIRLCRLIPRLIRYIRPGLVVSASGHLGALIVGLFLVSANPFQAPRPEAMVVEVVTPDEMPRFEGTPSTLRWCSTSCR
jgi:hypothetical protein